MASDSKDHEDDKATLPKVDDDDADSAVEDDTAAEGGAEASTSAAKKKKKKSKSKKLKDALSGKREEPTTAAGLSTDQIEGLMSMNPALRSELQGMDQTKLEAFLKNLKLSDALTGLSAGGKNQKDMASYKFWKTQPVPSFEDVKIAPETEGPLKIIDIDKVPKEPSPMVEGFEWCTVDLDSETELTEVYQLLSEHYVEDVDSTFRFHYSASFFTWALKSPGWKKQWHVGIRATKSQKLLGFISAIPVEIRIRDKLVNASEVNFLCVHKKLRNKRMAPVMIREITRRCYVEGIFQALFTSGVILPTPVATCRYYHRSLDWEKLYEVGFSPLPPGSTRLRQVAKYKVPEKTITPGLRPMEEKDIPAVAKLLTEYLARFHLGQVFSEEEVKHWLLHDPKICPDRIIYTYVVEDPEQKTITDFFSFYRLSSTVIKSDKHQFVNAAYLYYYATTTAFAPDTSSKGQADLKARLNMLVKDALILAKREKFDVMNALSLLENPLFLDDQLFGAGDGQLHYYLYNYRAAPFESGLEPSSNRASKDHMGGVGVVML